MGSHSNTFELCATLSCVTIQSARRQESEAAEIAGLGRERRPGWSVGVEVERGLTMDRITPERRSRNMARIRATDTAPEMAVRRLVHSLGFRYRLHTAALPGKPDLVFRRRRCVVFVHGCFWHQHPGCRRSFVPKVRVEYWSGKLNANTLRDSRIVSELQGRGWRVLTVWECETRQPEALKEKITMFLRPITRKRRTRPR